MEFSGNAVLPDHHDACVRFVIENYLERLKEQAYSQKDEQLWLHYYLLLYCAVPRRIPNSNFLNALLQDLPGTSFNEHTNYDELFEELSHQAFVEHTAGNALILHSLIREGIQFYLRANNPKLLQELHRRAADWFHEFDDRISYVYHRLRSEPSQGFEDLRRNIIDAIRQKQWAEVQDLIGTTVALNLGGVERGRISIFKAELAWAENNQNLALERLRGLYDRDGISVLGDEIARRLELWLGFHKGLENELAEGAAGAPAKAYLPDLLWWSTQRNLPVIKAHTLRVLGEEAIAQRELEEARKLIKESVGLFQCLGDNHACARGVHLLAELALTLGPFSDAEEYFQQGMELYRKLRQPLNQARLQAGKALALFYQGQHESARELLEKTLERQKELEDVSGQARTLKGLGHIHYLVLGRDSYEKTKDLLEQSLELFKKAGDTLGQAQVLMLLGDLAFEMLTSRDDRLTLGPQGVRQLFVDTAELFKNTKDHLGAARTQFVLGILAGMHIHDSLFRLENNFDIAVLHLRQARSLYHIAGDQLSQAHTEVAMGAMLYTMWKKHDKALGQAIEALENASETYEKYADTLGKASVSFVYGQFALWKLNYEEAEKLLAQAWRLFASVHTPFGDDMQSWTKDFLGVVRQKSGLPDKSLLHIGFVSRSRVMDLTGWSLAAQRETTEGLIIRDIEDNLGRRPMGF